MEWKKLPVLKVGRKVLIKTDMLELFMEANEGRDLRDADLLMPQEALFARGAHSMQALMHRALLRRGRSGRYYFLRKNVTCRKSKPDTAERGKQIMAIFHYTVKIVGRSKGKSIISASAYLNGDVMKNSNLPFRNSVYGMKFLKIEKNSDAQLGRSFEFSLPRLLIIGIGYHVGKIYFFIGAIYIYFRANVYYHISMKGDAI